MSRIYLLNNPIFHEEFTEKALRTFQSATKLLVSPVRPRPDAEEITPVIHKMSEFVFAPMLASLSAKQLGEFITTLGFYYEGLIISEDDALLQRVVARMMLASGVDTPPTGDDIARARYQLVTVIGVITLFEPESGTNQLAKLYPPAYRCLSELHAKKFHLQQRYMGIQANFVAFVDSRPRRKHLIQMQINGLKQKLIALGARLQSKLATDSRLNKVVGRLTRKGFIERYPQWQHNIEMEMEAIAIELGRQKDKMYELDDRMDKYAHSQREVAADIGLVEDKIGRVEDKLAANAYLMGIYERVAQRIGGEAATALPKSSAATEDKSAYVKWMAQFISSTLVADTTKMVAEARARQHKAVAKSLAAEMISTAITAAAARVQYRDEVHAFASSLAETVCINTLVRVAGMTLTQSESRQVSPAAADERGSTAGRGLGLFGILLPFSGASTPTPSSPAALSDDGGWDHADEESDSGAESDGEESPSLWSKLSSTFH